MDGYLFSTVMISCYLNFKSVMKSLKKGHTSVFQLLWDEDDRCTMHICIYHFLMNDLPKTVFEPETYTNPMTILKSPKW